MKKAYPSPVPLALASLVSKVLLVIAATWLLAGCTDKSTRQQTSPGSSAEEGSHDGTDSLFVRSFEKGRPEIHTPTVIHKGIPSVFTVVHEGVTYQTQCVEHRYLGDFDATNSYKLIPGSGHSDYGDDVCTRMLGLVGKKVPVCLATTRKTCIMLNEVSTHGHLVLYVYSSDANVTPQAWMQEELRILSARVSGSD